MLRRTDRVRKPSSLLQRRNSALLVTQRKKKRSRTAVQRESVPQRDDLGGDVDMDCAPIGEGAAQDHDIAEGAPQDIAEGTLLIEVHPAAVEQTSTVASATKTANPSSQQQAARARAGKVAVTSNADHELISLRATVACLEKEKEAVRIFFLDLLERKDKQWAEKLVEAHRKVAELERENGALSQQLLAATRDPRYTTPRRGSSSRRTSMGSSTSPLTLFPESLPVVPPSRVTSVIASGSSTIEGASENLSDEREEEDGDDHDQPHVPGNRSGKRRPTFPTTTTTKWRRRMEDIFQRFLYADIGHQLFRDFVCLEGIPFSWDDASDKIQKESFMSIARTRRKAMVGKIRRCTLAPVPTEEESLGQSTVVLKLALVLSGDASLPMEEVPPDIYATAFEIVRVLQDGADVVIPSNMPSMIHARLLNMKTRADAVFEDGSETVFIKTLKEMEVPLCRATWVAAMTEIAVQAARSREVAREAAAVGEVATEVRAREFSAEGNEEENGEGVDERGD